MKLVNNFPLNSNNLNKYEKYYSVKGQANHLKLGILLNFILLLFSTITQSQSLVNTFTYGNGSLGQIPLYSCESPLQLSIAYTDVQASDSIIIYFPNSFDIDALPAVYTVTQNTGSFVEIAIPVNGSEIITFNFQLRNCINNLAAAGSTLNTSDLQFQVYLRNNSGASTYTYNNALMPLSPGTPASITFSSAAAPFVINALTNTSFQGTANEIYYREFEIKVNAPTVENFDFSIVQENDVEHQELTLVDINPSGGTSSEISLNSSIGASNINALISLNAIAGYFTSVNNVRTLRFKQKVKLFCVQPNGFTTIRIERTCCPTPFISTANMYGKIQEGQVFYNTYTNVSRVDSTIQPSCGGSYNYDVVIQKAGAIALVDSILIPLNATFIDGIDSIFIGSQSYGFIPMLNTFEFHVHPIYPECSYLIIDFFNNYDSTIVWPGFQNYLDTTQTSTMGPWLDTNFFYLRIQFKYDCKKQQDCGSSRFHLQGKSLQSDTTILNNLDAPIQLAWRNSCEVDQSSMITPQTVQDSISNAYVGAFVNMDHDMEPDRVSYTLYPNNLHPFDIYAGQNLSGLSCDTITKYRAVFHIPVPDGAIDTVTRIDYSVLNLVVGNNLLPIVDTVNSNPDYGYFVNDTLTIPLGTNSHWPVNFSFDYVINNCPFGNPPNSGGIELNMEVQAYCASCNECYKTVACTTLTAVVHCPGDCIGQVPIGTKSVEMERAMFGFRDTLDFPDSPILTKEELAARIDSIIETTNPGMPDVIRETIIIDELSKLYPFDIVKLSSEGNLNAYPNLTVNGTGEPFQFENISFELAHTPIGNNPLFALKYANLKFVDTVAVDSFSVPLVIQNINPQNTGVFGMSGDTLYSFELGIANLSTLPQFNAINTGTYLLHLDAEFWVLPDASTPNNPLVIRGQFVCSTNVNAQVSTFSCDPWGTQLRVLVPRKSITLTTENDTVSHCITNAQFKVRLSGGLGDYLDDFPYEFRPFIGYGDTAFSSNFIEGFAIENGIDTIVFSDTLDKLWNPNNSLLHPLEKPGRQDIFIKANKFCSSGTDTIPYAIPFYDFAYISPSHFIDSIFAPTHLTSSDSLHLPQYMFYDSVNATNYTQSDIQLIKSPDWVYSSSNIFAGLFPGLPLSNQLLGIAESDSLHYNLHIKAPDSLSTGHCWVSYKFSNTAVDSPNLPVSIHPFLDTIPFLIDSLSVLDTLGETYHFFPQGFPLDSVSTQLVMPVVCGVNNYKLSLRYGCFCVEDSLQTFKEDVNKIPECLGGSAVVNFQRQGAAVNLTWQLQVNNDTAGCDLTWWIDVANPAVRSNLTQGKLLINIPSGLVLNTASSTFDYYLPGETLASQSGNYLNDTIEPNYSFQFEDFLTPPTTVLVLAFPSVDTLQAGAHLLFGLRFKLDQSTCNLTPAVFQSNFLYRILEARFTGYTECNDTTLYTSPFTAQSFFNNAFPTIQSQITDMATSDDCCLQSAATVSLHQPCSEISLGTIRFHFTGEGDNHISLYQIDSLTNDFVIVEYTTLNDTLIEFAVTQGLYSATVTTSGGLIYVFNSLGIQNHGVDAHLFLTQNSLCGGSPISLTAVDSNAVNNVSYNNSNPFIATDTLVTNIFQYQWSSNATADSLTNAIAYDSTNSDTSYNVIITHLSGCSDTASIAVEVNELVVASILQLGDSICSSMNYAISVSPTGGTLTVNGLENTDLVLDPSVYSTDSLIISYAITSDSGCVSHDTITTYSSASVCNCQYCDDPGAAVFVIGSDIDSTSQLTNSLGSHLLLNRCIQLDHDLVVDSYFEFRNCVLTIAGGKEILVMVSETLKLDSCTLQGCEQMWAGINNFGKLLIDNSTIKDAHFGILMRRNVLAYSNVQNTTFENNFVGIKSGDELGEHPLALKRNSFVGGVLLQPFPNQSPMPLSYSLAGIVAVNHYNLTVTSESSFKDLCNGILLYKYASTHVFQTTFENIQPFGVPYQGSSYWLDNQMLPLDQFNNVSGNGVFASVNSYAFVGGFSQLNPENWGNITQFNNCNKGVYARESDVYVRNCSFDNVNIGIRGLNLRGKMFKIFKNRIRSKIQGISLMQSDYMLTDTIGFNTITSLPIIPQLPQLSFNKGIFVSNQQMGYYVTILGNKITASFGIEINSASGIKIQSDTVSILPFSFFNFGWDIGTGLYISNTHKARISCNVINGNTAMRQTAVSLVNSLSGHIKNNLVNSSRYGFRVTGNCQTDSFKLNTINNHQIGLDITATGILGNQINNGNKWTGSYSITPARRQSSNIFGGGLSSFTIHNPSDSEIYPLLPPFQPFVGVCLGDFFYCNFSATAPPEPFCSVVAAPAFITSGGSHTDQEILARLLAKDSLTFDPFTEPLKFALSKDIYQAMSSQQLSLPDTGIFVAFKEAYQQSPEQNYVYADQAQALNEISEITQQIKKGYLMEMDLVMGQIDVLDSIIRVDNLYDDIEMINQRSGLVNTIYQIKLQLQLIDNNVLEKQGFSRDSAFLYNNGVVTNIEFQDYERRVNKIYLNTVAQNNFTFEADQISELSEIAHLCPALGGTAVFKARSLYALINDTALYNDDGVCLQQGVMYRLEQSTSSESNSVSVNSFKIYPNPTSGRFIIKNNVSEDLGVSIHVLNSIGQLIYKTSIKFSGEFGVDILDSAAQGLYFVQVFGPTGAIILNEKLIKR